MTEARWPYFPIFLRLSGQRVLLVGGGEVALRKARLLLRAGATIEVVAREIHPELLTAGVRQLAGEFDPAQLHGARLVIAATDDAELNARVSEAARAAFVPVNVVDDPELSDWITPSIVDRAPVLLAISSSGSAPVLARRLREQIESLWPSGLGRVAEFLAGARERLRQGPIGLRRRVIESFLDGAGPEKVLAGATDDAKAELERHIAGQSGRGEVYLVGGGPGDPDLLTLKALRLMQQADVVLYDRLVSPAVLDRVRRDAERIFVGKGPKRHEMPQEDINALLVRLAQKGQRVLRLKGGDPFIFGRGGEEIDTLAANGISFQVVPGITAANGCAAYAGIPLTHRDYAQTVMFVTGHARKDGVLELDWPTLARRGQTVVFYMGRGSMPTLCQNLVLNGLPGDWPAALVEQGTLAEQKVVVGTLGNLPARVDAAGITGASLLIVGEVVRLRDRLRWFGPAKS